MRTFIPDHISDNTLQQWLTVGNGSSDVATRDSFQVNTVSMLGAPQGSYSFTADDITALSINQ